MRREEEYVGERVMDVEEGGEKERKTEADVDGQHICGLEREGTFG